MCRWSERGGWDAERTSTVAIETFASDRINEIHCGTVDLSVPLRQDVIQIGAGGDADVGSIRVSRDSRMVTVARVDGRPMQVDIVTDGPDRSYVFDAPVPELRLVRTADRWRPVGACGAVDIAAIKRFADVVGTFAAAKQRTAQHSQRG